MVDFLKLISCHGFCGLKPRRYVFCAVDCIVTFRCVVNAEGTWLTGLLSAPEPGLWFTWSQGLLELSLIQL